MSLGARWIIAGLVVLALIGGVAVYATGAFQRLFGGARNDVVIASGEAAVRAMPAAVKVNAVRTVQATAARGSAQRLNTVAQRLSVSTAVAVARFDSALQELSHAPGVTPAAGRIILAVGHACHDAITLCTARGDSLQARGDSLERADSIDKKRGDEGFAIAFHNDTIIQGLLKIADCHMLGIRAAPRCLTRTQAYVAGVFTGLSIGTVVVVLARTGTN